MYTTGHLDACSGAVSVPKAHMDHLLSCSAATDLPKSSHLVTMEWLVRTCQTTYLATGS